jgi:hypothetical protein
MYDTNYSLLVVVTCNLVTKNIYFDLPLLKEIAIVLPLLKEIAIVLMYV